MCSMSIICQPYNHHYRRVMLSLAPLFWLLACGMYIISRTQHKPTVIVDAHLQLQMLYLDHIWSIMSVKFYISSIRNCMLPHWLRRLNELLSQIIYHSAKVPLWSGTSMKFGVWNLFVKNILLTTYMYSDSKLLNKCAQSLSGGKQLCT